MGRTVSTINAVPAGKDVGADARRIQKVRPSVVCQPAAATASLAEATTGTKTVATTTAAAARAATSEATITLPAFFTSPSLPQPWATVH